RAYELARDGNILVRRALLLSPVAASEEQVLEERQNLVVEVDRLTKLHREGLVSVRTPADPLERAPFYVVYAGDNQRSTVEAITRMCSSLAPEVTVETENLPVQDGEQGRECGTTCITSGSTAHQQDESTRSFFVGFVSTLFGEKACADEPHGMILEGLVLHLPRPRFHVTVCAMRGKASQTLAAGADRLVTLPRTVIGAKRELAQLRRVHEEVVLLDVLVFADTTCDPATFLLTLGRVAPIQAAFLGNAITSGSPAIDYFISADVIESPSRTTMTAEDEPYTEQVVLLGGQGIWYPIPDLPGELVSSPPPTPSFLGGESPPHAKSNGVALQRKVARVSESDDRHNVAALEDFSVGSTSAPSNASKIDVREKRPPSDSATDNALAEGVRVSRSPREKRRAVLRAELKDRIGINRDSVVYMCAQSMFKLHPRLDLAVKGLLEASLANHIVFTEGRNPRWTLAFQQRLRSTIGDTLMQRVFFVPRTDEYFSLLASADVALHPFPFGGSKTSADALALGVPTVAMVGQYAFGRMAQSFYKTMGLTNVCCVADDLASYVNLAARLGRDTAFRNHIVDLIDQREWALWERRDEVYEWARFLARVGGFAPPTPQEVSL
ncbi:unnamed protein product, partial [Hapterophycus canaliculatus]